MILANQTRDCIQFKLAQQHTVMFVSVLQPNTKR